MLKRQIPVRTFADWDEGIPGFMEADLVAHCGPHPDGAFLATLVMIDVATGWLECQALLYRSQDQVLQGLRRARQLIPFPLLGLDTDNGGEFITNDLVAYCAQEQITFTRGRPYHKNDQCFVEQKNGAVVRHFVGYDRYEGEHAYRQLVELYRALRLYVNFFQPSLKLKEKRQTGKAVQRIYLPAQTPFERLCAASVLSDDVRTRMDAIFAALDPVRLLDQIGQLQAALWSQAAVSGDGATSQSQPPPVRFVAEVGGVADSPPPPESVPPLLRHQKRAYRRSEPALPRWWKTRPDPFAVVWAELEQWLEAAPTRTAKSLFGELQQRYPDQYAPVQLRTLQRRIAKWRTTMITTFDDHWLHDEVLAPTNLPRPLGVARTVAPDGEQ
ncbi:transposase family protein [Chloroflexales bacterium ZM16-3]|nr:transposase family protein [Chloroflexales bacterium ZM16-3]